MDAQVLWRDDIEQSVVRLWRDSHLSERVIVGYLERVRLFRTYCRRRGFDETSQLTLKGVKRFADAHIGSRTKRVLIASNRACFRNAIHAWAFTLGCLKFPVPEWKPTTKPARLNPLLAAYSQYRLSHCGVVNATLRRDVQTAGDFLRLMRVRGKNVSRASLEDIDAFVAQLSNQYCKGTVVDLCSYVRSFLRFLRTTGRIRRDLAACNMAPSERPMARPPRALPWEAVRKIIRSIPHSNRLGKRDYAMLLMMAAYGLGAAEVLGLQLDDVDWKLKILHARRSKTGVAITLPLLPPIAKALAAYLKRERPNHADTRKIFLARGIPHRPLTSGAIRHRIRLYANKAGIKASVIGAHAFRHSHATRQIDIGAHPKVISDILGHSRPSSTSVYVRVAIKRLRAVALPVPR
jgi:integrase/recombinase XerD